MVGEMEAAGLGEEAEERITSPIFALVFLSSCSVILESDPQQVIQKVNFRVSLPSSLLTPISSRLPFLSSHFPSSLGMGLPGPRWWKPEFLWQRPSPESLYLPGVRVGEWQLGGGVCC